MITTNTVFILGAGASNPFGYPIGSGLRDAICRNLQGRNANTDEVAQALAEDKGDVPSIEKAVIEFRDRFYRSSETTIDAFIENNYKAYGQIAKLAIAQVLINVEDEEALHFNPKENWYIQLYKLMKSSPPNNFHHNKVAFITFNYDLSLDQFLYNSLLNSTTTLNQESCKQIFKDVPIIHLYGQLGQLAWQAGDNRRHYGSKKLTKYQLREIVKGIKTGFDSFDFKTDANFKLALSFINEARNIYFIGFGFDKFNLDKLPLRSMSGKRIIGTCYKMDPGVIASTKECFRQFAETDIALVELDALNFVLRTNIQ